MSAGWLPSAMKARCTRNVKLSEYSRRQRVDEQHGINRRFGRHGTGHVALFALPPQRVPGYADAYLLCIVEATSLLRADDTRGYGSGFGLGTIRLVSDDARAPRAYGWVGLHWRAFETAIAIGRPTR